MREEQALAIREKHFGPDHPKVGIVLRGIGRLLYSQGDLEGAASYFGRALTILEATGGSDQNTVLTLKADLVGVMMMQGKNAEAIPLRPRFAALRRRAGPAFSQPTARDTSM